MDRDLLRIRRMQAQEKANFFGVAVDFDPEADVIRTTGSGERFYPEQKNAPDMRAALRQLFDEVIAAGFETITDYNWPKAIADAKAALGES